MSDPTTAASPLPDPASARLVVTGAAGLVGQNLVRLLYEQGYRNITALDAHAGNLAILKHLNPEVTTIHADLSLPGPWQEAFAGADGVFQLQAQIGAKDSETFDTNTIRSTEAVLAACHRHRIPYLVHVSSSVVNSVADDDYTRSKIAQEKLVAACSIPYSILRPTLMFGWFDRKHLGWLSRFMAKTPVFPIPGDGRYLRQPLYVRDLCRALAYCMQQRPHNATYDLVGPDGMDYIDLIRTIRQLRGLHCLVLPIPIAVFAALLRIYALFSRNPPFTADQLVALTAGDVFTGVDMAATFHFKPTPLKDALRETFTTQPWANIVLER